MDQIRKIARFWAKRMRAGSGTPDWLGLAREIERARPDLPRLGTAKHPRGEAVRFGQIPSLKFPASAIADIAEGTGDIEARISSYFFGLLGPNGPMPLEFTYFVFSRSYNAYDNTWRRFLDIIHHRLQTLFYRADAVNEQSISFDRETDDPVRAVISAFAGMPPDQPNPTGNAALFLKNAACFGLRVKTRGGLEDVLSRLVNDSERGGKKAWRMPLEVRDFVGASYDIPAESRAVLGNPVSAVLGVNAQIGRTYQSMTRRFEIRIGPADFAACRLFLPGRDGFALLIRATRLYLDRPLDFDVRFILKSDSIPPAELGWRARLGRCWLGIPVGPTAEIVKSVYAEK